MLSWQNGMFQNNVWIVNLFSGLKNISQRGRFIVIKASKTLLCKLKISAFLLVREPFWGEILTHCLCIKGFGISCYFQRKKPSVHCCCLDSSLCFLIVIVPEFCIAALWDHISFFQISDVLDLRKPLVAIGKSGLSVC